MTTAWFTLLPLAFSYVKSSQIGLPVTVALAAVALIGYLFGQRNRATLKAKLDERRQQELDRAVRIAWQLETIARGLRHDLVDASCAVAAFKRRLRQAQERSRQGLGTLCNEAEAMLGPTMQLAHQLSHAYDQIRQQSDALETFTQGRTDPLTGVGNGRALEQQLRVLVDGAAPRQHRVCGRAGEPRPRFDNGRGPLAGQRVADAAAAGERHSHVHAGHRFRGPLRRREFVVVMPQTSLAGRERVRRPAAQARGRRIGSLRVLRPGRGSSQRRCAIAAGPGRFGAVQREGGRAEPAVRPHGQPTSASIIAAASPTEGNAATIDAASEPAYGPRPATCLSVAADAAGDSRC